MAAGGLTLAGCTSAADRHPARHRASTSPPTTALLTSGAFRSAAMAGQRVGWTICTPPGTPVDGLPVCLVLHGRGDTHRAAFGWLGLQHVLPAAAEAHLFALVSVDGGADSYYHRRVDGTDAQAMIVDELLPLLEHHGLRAGQRDRIGLFGWSMGGYGALLLAERLRRERVAAVAVDSPALWLRASDAAPGAFDGAADFARHDVFAHRARLGGIAVRVLIGRADPFLVATRAFVAGLPGPAQPPSSVVLTGGHDAGFWRATRPSQLAFLARVLRRG